MIVAAALLPVAAAPSQASPEPVRLADIPEAAAIQRISNRFGTASVPQSPDERERAEVREEWVRPPAPETTQNPLSAATHIVRFDADATVEDMQRVVELVADAGGAVVSSLTGAFLFLFAVLPPATATRIESDDSVVAVTENRTFTVGSQVRNDAPWNLDRVDQVNLPLDGRFRFEQTGSGVPVYVVDTGLSYVQFEGVERYPYTPVALFHFSSDPVRGNDCVGHGTHVAGTIVDPTYGIAPDADLIVVKASIGCESGFSEAALISGLSAIKADRDEYYPGQHAVVNLSLGGVGVDGDTAFDDLVKNLIDDGFTVIAAAGNDNADACDYSPARVPAAITVGATAQSDARAAFSNPGPCVDIFAPGVQIPSITRISVQSGQLVVTVSELSGTSMAAPLTAGLVALLLEKDPGLSPAQVKARLVEAAQPKVTDLQGSPNRLLHAPAATGFFDVAPSLTFTADIAWLASQGITRGCNSPALNLYCPKQEVTRGQMAAFLVRTLNLPPAPSAEFIDVTPGSTFEDAINRLAAAGITKGCGSNRFCPSDPVLREQMAAFLKRGFSLRSAPSAGFSDVVTGSTFEVDINALAAAGITRGCTADRYCPKEPVLREQMAAFLRRAVEGP